MSFKQLYADYANIGTLINNQADPLMQVIDIGDGNFSPTPTQCINSIFRVTAGNSQGSITLPTGTQLYQYLNSPPVGYQFKIVVSADFSTALLPTCPASAGVTNLNGGAGVLYGNIPYVTLTFRCTGVNTFTFYNS